MAITLETRTPLWTGGVGNKADKIHSIGVIGSLRWWYEAIWRGMGVNVCDPTNNPCKLNNEGFLELVRNRVAPAEAAGQSGLCPACQLFGATGWARQFRLKIEDSTLLEPSHVPMATTDEPSKNIQRLNHKMKHPRYFYPEGRIGKFEIEIIPCSRTFQPNIILGLLKLIEAHGSLTSKGQLGYGSVAFEPPLSFDASAFLQNVFLGRMPAVQPDDGLPNLRYMFFAEYELFLNDDLQTLTNLKFDLRQAFRSGPSSIAKAFDSAKRADLRHHLLGTIKSGKTEGAKIFLSRIRDHQIRVWGWISEKNLNSFGVSRDEVVNHLQAELNKNSKNDRPSKWREFNSTRDALRTANYLDYLKSLF